MKKTLVLSFAAVVAVTILSLPGAAWAEPNPDTVSERELRGGSFLPEQILTTFVDWFSAWTGTGVLFEPAAVYDEDGGDMEPPPCGFCEQAGMIGDPDG